MDITAIIVALVAAGAASVPGVLAFVRDKRRTDAESDKIRDDIEAALWARVKAENAAMSARVAILELEVTRQRRQLEIARGGLRQMMAQLERLGIKPEWVPPADWEDGG